MEEELLMGERESSNERMDGEWKWRGMWEEVKKLAALAGPMVVVTTTQFLTQLVSTMMVGHLGELSLSSASIATSLTGVTGFSLLVGMASALETLCGQAYGAQQYRLLGLYTQRAMISLLLVSLPVSLFWVYMENCLTLVGQDPLISFEAGKYARWRIPGLFANAIVQPLVKFLLSQGLVLPMVFNSVATIVIHAPLCWMLVYKCGMGNVGAALAISVSNWLGVAILGSYVQYSPSCEKTRLVFSREVFAGIQEFLWLAIPSAVMICLEWWSFELLILFSGLLPNAKLETSVLSICLNSIVLLYTIPIALGAASSTRVSNELGAGNPQKARIATSAAMLISATEILVVGTILISARHVLGYAFSNEKEVIDYVSIMVPLICLTVITDGIQGVLSGIIRGCGRQHIGAYINLGSFYLFGIPIAVLLGFALHFGGKGLWVGVVCGSTVQATCLSLITLLTDWKQQADKARTRLFEERLLKESGILN